MSIPAEKFSIVMAFRDTPRERDFSAKSIPSAIRLQPDELVIGIDEPAREEFVAHIRKMCSENSFANYKLVKVPLSEEWNMQLAQVMWKCYEACSHDKILTFDVDTVLRPAVLKGCGLVGGENAVVSFTKKIVIKGPRDAIRYTFYRLRVRHSDFVFSGVYWIYRPYYYLNVDLEGFKQIHNGTDTYLIDRVTSLKTHKILTLKEMGVNSMDIENGHYPWRQFDLGIWMYANRNAGNGFNRAPKSSYAGGIMGYMYKFMDRHPLCKAVIYAIAYQEPWVLRGYLWAGKHAESELVRTATGISYSEWTYHSSKYVKGIRDWKKHGRLGTGFDKS